MVPEASDVVGVAAKFGSDGTHHGQAQLVLDLPVGGVVSVHGMEFLGLTSTKVVVVGAGLERPLERRMKWLMERMIARRHGHLLQGVDSHQNPTPAEESAEMCYLRHKFKSTVFIVDVASSLVQDDKFPVFDNPFWDLAAGKRVVSLQ